MSINLPIQIQLPNIWEGTFQKSSWNSINFIVGANGTGKSLFSVELKNALSQQGIKVRLLSAERMAGFEKSDYNYFTSSQVSQGLNISNFDRYKRFGSQYGLSSSAFIILKERLDIRIKIEALLSDLFRKTIRLAEEGGFLTPKMQDIDGGNEYSLKEQECHGMKEIISLLTFLYDDSNNCLIFDEPELHLHPQFQSFFLNEIRNVAGNPYTEPGKKIIYIITHSPFFLDFRTLDDVKHVLVCHNHEKPTYVSDGDLDLQDEYVIKKFLPRFNTHHKQFFFSPNPVFVEGYTDQQFITLLFEKTGLNIAASGSSVIDVGGKDELAVFYKLCKILHIDCRIIADYDALFRGKLREYICATDTIKQQFINHGFGGDIANCIGSIERTLVQIADQLVAYDNSQLDVKNIKDKLEELYTEKAKNIGTIKDVVLLSLYRYKQVIVTEVPAISEDVNSVLAKHKNYLDCLKVAKIFIVPSGELEHFYKANSVDYLNISRKDTAFAKEYESILGTDDAEMLRQRYSDILPLLYESVPHIKVDLLEHIRFTMIDWIQNVQSAVVRGEVNSIGSLRSSSRVNYALYSQILECKDDGFVLEENNNFECHVILKPEFLGYEKEVVFSSNTLAKDFIL
ncbi:MAG: AAA family ATPase [Bacteroidales bacterium]|nr:AAA family ATPase [Bacteroidales bacterium]